MDFKDIRRNPDPRKSVRAELREVVTDFAGQQRLLIRLRLAGWNFPERAPEPFMVVGRTISERVLIAPDGLSAAGYFAEPVPEAEGVSFGYGDTVTWDFPVSIRPERMRRLDRRRLADIAIPERLR